MRLENWALLGRSHQFEFRYPFLDPEVVEFCLGLPACFFLRGEPQRVLRLAMAGRIPESVRLRKSRIASITDWPLRKLRKHPRERKRLQQLERNELLSQFVDLSPIHGALDKFPDEGLLRQVVSEQGLAAASELLHPGGVSTSPEYFRSFARFFERNGFC